MLSDPHRRSRFPRRRAALTSEALIVLPVLVIVTLAVFIFGMLVTVRNAVTYAAIEGAREAAKGLPLHAIPANPPKPDVVTVAYDILKPYNIPITPTDITDPDWCVILERKAPADVWGALPCKSPTNPVNDALNYVRVTVGVSAASVPLANQLQSFGLTFVGDLLTASAVVKIECP